MEKIDALMEMYNRNNEFTGGILISREGDFFYEKTFYEEQAKSITHHNQGDTKYPLYSLTKQFTAMLILQLIEEGEFHLDTRVVEIIPNRLPEDLKLSMNDITVYHLLTHTSGLQPISKPIEIQNIVFSKWEIISGIPTKLLYEPGTAHNYNNINYYLLGFIVEKLYGKPYGVVLEEQICSPLGLKDTGYHDKYDLKNTEFTEKDSLSMEDGFAASGMYASVKDMYIWSQALDTENLLSKEYQAVMVTPFYNYYGCGWYINKLEDGRTVIWHGGGSSEATYSYIAKIPEDKITIIVLTTKNGIPYHLLKQLGMIMDIITKENS